MSKKRDAMRKKIDEWLRKHSEVSGVNPDNLIRQGYQLGPERYVDRTLHFMSEQLKLHPQATIEDDGLGWFISMPTSALPPPDPDGVIRLPVTEDGYFIEVPPPPSHH